MRSHFRSALQTTSAPLRCFSRSIISTLQTRQFLEFISRILALPLGYSRTTFSALFARI